MDGSIIWHSAVLTSQVNRLVMLGEEGSVPSLFDLSTEKANKTSSYRGGFIRVRYKQMFIFHKVISHQMGKVFIHAALAGFVPVNWR